MNWKLVVVGGLVFYAVTFVVGFATGPLIHNGILKEPYRQNLSFWQPALQQDPPDMAALMPRWVATGILGALVQAALYGWIRGGFRGKGWQKGMKYGLLLSLFGCTVLLAWSGVFNLPNKIWVWWGLEQFAYYLLGGAALGWVSQKLAPEPA